MAGETSSQGDRTRASLEKCQLELSTKNKLLDTLRKENDSLANKNRLLEYRSTELERLEIELQNTKHALEDTKTSLRDTRFTLDGREEELKETQKQLAHEKKTTEKLNSKIEYLNWQVQREFISTAGNEKQLERIPLLEGKVDKFEAEVEHLKKELELQEARTFYAKKRSLEQRDKCKELQEQMEGLTSQQEEWRLAKAETATLRRLIVGKNALVVQKTQALDVAQEVITKMEHADLDIVKQVRQLIERSSRSYPDSPREDSSSTTYSDLSDSRSRLNGSRLSLYEENNNNNPSISAPATMDPPRPVSAPRLRRPQRTQSLLQRDVTSLRTDGHFVRGGDVRRSSSLRRERDRNTPSRASSNSITFAEPLVTRNRPPRSSGSTAGSKASISSSEPSRMTSASGKGRDDVRVALSGLDAGERASMLAKCVAVGDRVRVQPQPLPDKTGAKEQTAIIKYVGRLDKSSGDKVYFGLKLESPDGDTDGTYKGKRYFAVPERFGRIVSAQRIISVYSKSTKNYRPLANIIEEKKSPVWNGSVIQV